MFLSVCLEVLNLEEFELEVIVCMEINVDFEMFFLVVDVYGVWVLFDIVIFLVMKMDVDFVVGGYY